MVWLRPLIVLRVCSSVVERYVDIVEVASSILAIPTKNNVTFRVVKI